MISDLCGIGNAFSSSPKDVYFTQETNNLSNEEADSVLDIEYHITK